MIPLDVPGGARATLMRSTSFESRQVSTKIRGASHATKRIRGLFDQLAGSLMMVMTAVLLMTMMLTMAGDDEDDAS